MQQHAGIMPWGINSLLNVPILRSNEVDSFGPSLKRLGIGHLIVLVSDFPTPQRYILLKDRTKINAIRIHFMILTAKQEYTPFYYPLKLANV